ncbi:cytochrome P450 [Actinoplanes sp. NPDC049265]|uniref:cytochrome P450 n=1 Tax=Actinoplanes sp. NPDC049265 TaxID=3363902 RepID=UPI0037219D34
MSVTTGTGPPAALLAEPSWYRRLPAGTDVHALGTGLVAVTGHAAVREALTHPAVLAEHPLKASARVLGPNVLDADGPRHRAFRVLMAPILAAGRIAEYRAGLMPPLVRSLADRLAGVTTDDFHGRYAHVVPYGIVGELLGVGTAAAGTFHRLTRPLAGLLDLPTEETDATHTDTAELLRLIERHRTAAGPGDRSLLATIERTRDRKGISLTDDEVRATALLFFLAGTETSSAFITSLVYTLAGGDVPLGELLDPTVRDAFVDEVLRLRPPVQTVVRFATDDVTIAGVPVPRHTAVLISIASANRDPRVFAEPDRLRLGRGERGAIPFAAGAHACPGAPLARAEFGLLLEALAERCSDIVLGPDQHRTTSQSFARPTGFTVEFRAR